MLATIIPSLILCCPLPQLLHTPQALRSPAIGKPASPSIQTTGDSGSATIQVPVEGEATPQDPKADELAKGPPRDADPEAVIFWNLFCEASRASRSEGSLQPIEAFRLEADVLAEVEGGSHDLHPTLTYLHPKYIQIELGSGRKLVRGPDGDWLQDGDEAVLLVGRDTAEDRQQLDQLLSLARNLVGLMQPEHLHLSRLVYLEKAPSPVPHDLSGKSKRLDWFEFSSPDFSLFKERGRRSKFEEPPSFHVAVGLNRETHNAEYALITDTSPGLRAAAPIFLTMLKPRPMDGNVLPGEVSIYTVEPGVSPWIFKRKPTQRLWLKTGTLRAELKPDDFQFPK